MYCRYEDREVRLQSYIRQLVDVLPYPLHWYETLSDKEVIGIRAANLNKILAAAIRADEDHVQRRVHEMMM